MDPILATYVMTAIAGLVGAAPTTPTQPAVATARLQAFYRQGQTFITWAEADDVDHEQYVLYRSLGVIFYLLEETRTRFLLYS